MGEPTKVKEWPLRLREFTTEKAAFVMAPQETATHPLQPEEKPAAGPAATVTVSKPKVVAATAKPAAAAKVSSPLDPLGAGGDDDDILNDPLQALSNKPKRADDYLENEVLEMVKNKAPALGSEVIESFVPWSGRKSAILSRYTTSESLSITTSFLSSNAPKLAQDKTKERLEQLDADEDDVQEHANLSQKEYVQNIETLNSELKRAWENDERVKSLKIAIQAAKLLSDINPIRFYPSKFTLVTEILDSFGRLVFERIRSKAFQPKDNVGQSLDGLPENFRPENVNSMAKETCRNWFYKIASIREILPRIYVEMAIMRCYCFLNDSEYGTALNRLTAMMRGLGDPLVALYARTYLVRKGTEVAPMRKDYLNINYSDVLFVTKQVTRATFEQRLTEEWHLTTPEYYDLFSPGLDWIFSCLGNKAEPELRASMLRRYMEGCNVALVLSHILENLSPSYIAQNALLLLDLIKRADNSSPRHVLYRTLGANLVMCPPSKAAQEKIITEVWMDVMQLNDPSEFVSVAEVFVEFNVKMGSLEDVNKMLSDIIDKLMTGRVYEKLLPQLQSIVGKILSHIRDFTKLYGMSKFMPLIDLFDGAIKVDVCKSILETFAKYQDPTDDQVIVNGLLYVARVVHDSVNALTFDDENKQIAKLLVAVIRKIGFGGKFEAHLSFLVDCRQAFGSVDSVKSALVSEALHLAMRTLYTLVKRGRRHTRKTGDFVRACLAYCFITIPSIESPFIRAEWYLIGGKVALQNHCLPQSDAFFKHACLCVPELPAHNESDLAGVGPWLASYARSFAATLIMVPGSPENGPFHLIKPLIRVVKEYPWPKGFDEKFYVLLDFITMLTCWLQNNAPYAINGIDTNEFLYGGDPSFPLELQLMINTLFDEVLKEVAALSDVNDVGAKKRLGQLAIEICNYMLTVFELNQQSATLILNLYKIACKHGLHVKQQIANLLKHVGAHAGESQLHAGLYNRLSEVTIGA